MTEPAIQAEHLGLAYRMAKDRAASMKEYTINLLKRQVTYQQLWALDDVSFEVAPGERFGIIGQNGAGKSTLLKAISGVLAPTTGRIVTRGRISPLIELSGGLNPEMTGRENIVMFGTLLGRDPKHMETRIDSIAKWAEIEDFLDTPTRAYSTGMVSRLAFSIATDVKPEILLIDEVLSVGDEHFKRKSNDRMDELMADGTTVVLVSHALRDIETLTSRVMWLERGRIKMIDKPSTVVAAYRASS